MTRDAAGSMSGSRGEPWRPAARSCTKSGRRSRSSARHTGAAVAGAAAHIRHQHGGAAGPAASACRARKLARVWLAGPPCTQITAAMARWRRRPPAGVANQPGMRCPSKLGHSTSRSRIGRIDAGSLRSGRQAVRGRALRPHEQAERAWSGRSRRRQGACRPATRRGRPRCRVGNPAISGACRRSVRPAGRA